MAKKSLQDLSEHFLELEKRISRVRFARIEASKRLKVENQRYSMITSLYGILITFIAIAFSIVNFTDLNNYIDESINALFEYQKVSVIILAFSSFITMLTLYIANKGYGEKAARFQSNYMELTRLHSDIKNFMIYYHLHSLEAYKDFKRTWEHEQYQTYKKKKDLDKRLVKKYRTFADKYAALLTQSENHEDIDYKRACKDELIKKNREEQCKISNESDYLKIKSNEERIEELTNEIKHIKNIEGAKFLCISGFPFIVLIILWIFSGLISSIGILIS